MGMPVGESDRARLHAIAASDRPLAPHECAERARLAASLVEPGRLDRSGAGEAVLLWRDEHSEAWLNLWWQPRDTGYHDHTGSCVGVHVIEGCAWNEPLTIGEPPKARQYGPGETFWFPGEGIHRMDHQAGAITIHVYSPPIKAIGHYDLHDGQLRRTEVLPDQPSPPSAALYEALHRPAAAGQASHGRSEDLAAAAVWAWVVVIRRRGRLEITGRTITYTGGKGQPVSLSREQGNVLRVVDTGAPRYPKRCLTVHGTSTVIPLNLFRLSEVRQASMGSDPAGFAGCELATNFLS